LIRAGGSISLPKKETKKSYASIWFIRSLNIYESNVYVYEFVLAGAVLQDFVRMLDQSWGVACASLTVLHLTCRVVLLAYSPTGVQRHVT
jgi:hypothetical protein